jgi:hypothetical protein
VNEFDLQPAVNLPKNCSASGQAREMAARLSSDD